MVSFYEIVEESHLFAGLMLNSLFIFSITRFAKSLGSYKTLLLMFGAYDIFLGLLHLFLKPRVIVVGNLMGCAADYWDSILLTVFYCSCNTVPFILMIIDFLYRYWAISRRTLIPLFSNKMFIVFLFLAVLTEYTIWFNVMIHLLSGEESEIINGKIILREETVRRLGHEITEGWAVFNYWDNDVLNVRALCAITILNSIMLVSFTTATVLGGLTYYAMYVHTGRMGEISPYALSLQRKLFISLCAQTAVPVFLVYIPYAVCINFPFFNLPVFFWDDACMLLTSCFPAWDAVIAMALMTDCRKGLIGMIWKKKKTTGAVSMFTTQQIHRPLIAT